jgi:hypothetical protein
MSEVNWNVRSKSNLYESLIIHPILIDCKERGVFFPPEIAPRKKKPDPEPPAMIRLRTACTN